MSKIRLYGSTSGYLELKAPAVAPDAAVEIPASFGPYGKVLQVVTATDATNRSTTSTSYVDANISVSITPQSATSTIIVIWTHYMGHGNGGESVCFGRITDSANTALTGAEEVGHQAYWDAPSAALRTFRTGVGFVSAGTTSARTYKGRFRRSGSGGTATIYNATNTGRITAIEIGA